MKKKQKQTECILCGKSIDKKDANYFIKGCKGFGSNQVVVICNNCKV